MPFSFLRRRHERTEAEQLVESLSGLAYQVAEELQGGANGDLNRLLYKILDNADARATAAREKLERRERRYREEALQKAREQGREEGRREERRRAEIERRLRESQRTEKAWIEARSGNSSPQRRLENGSERGTRSEREERKPASKKAGGMVEGQGRVSEGEQRNDVRFDTSQGAKGQGGSSVGKPLRDVSSRHWQEQKKTADKASDR